MLVLNWDKPPRKMSVEAWKSISADGAPPGVYSPNMSDEDAKRWNAKLIGTRSGPLRVEIRSSRGGSQLLCVVALQKIKERHREYNVRISTNGPLFFTFEDWEQLNKAIEEAKQKMNEVQN